MWLAFFNFDAPHIIAHFDHLLNAMQKFVGAALLVLLTGVNAANEVSLCPKFIDQRFCESAATKDGLAYFEWQRSPPQNEPWHVCTYPGDDYGCGNIPKSVQPRKIDRDDNVCGRCNFDGYSSSFCHNNTVDNSLAIVVIDYKVQGCQKEAVEKRDGEHSPPRYYNLSTEVAPACVSTAQGKICDGQSASGVPFNCRGEEKFDDGKCEGGRCCSPQEPPKTCETLGGDTHGASCPDAGSHTQCEDKLLCGWFQDEKVNPVESYWKLEPSGSALGR